MDGQIQLFKSAEKDQVEQEVIRTYFGRWVLGLAPANWTQVAGEDELGMCIPHVFPRIISCIFHNTVRIGRDHKNCVLRLHVGAYIMVVMRVMENKLPII